ncbi:pyridoxal-phosphate dependent enzyme [Shewanella sp. 202IG2-18]|uniref:pyridoxal-phosphate dependent enzyme n=1 Tax=Parashewanella hymeniacidonis TaxID=2807618 RepID=UPI00195FBFFE|nr:pyridoxal-phosphate dependent enzyme [Parashewanella hymeniacidonis]MBM7074126.1 pyridoxal-phosphate dependent enzyme [Parashewanella hymeniacidonis]
MLHIQTPLIQSLSIPQNSDTKVWLKLENCQPSGSFKVRGVGNACEYYIQHGAKKLYASSGGNAGLAVAYCGRKLNVPVTIVVPKTTKQKAIELIEQEGAKVIVHGDVWFEAHEYALSLLDDESAYIHPYDDPLLWQGHASMIDEVVEQGVTPDAVLLSVGGGGLLLGVAKGLEKNGLSDIPVFAVETIGADALAQSMSLNKRISLDAISSIATSLGASQVAESAFELTKTGRVMAISVEDSDAVDACYRFLNEHRMLVEPACSASLSVAYHHKHNQLKHYRNILVIVCGGVGITPTQLDNWKKHFKL